MKILYLSNGLTHYYNPVLSKLNSVPGVKIIAVVPKNKTIHIGDGVYQTREGVNFEIRELEERTFSGVFSFYRGLAGLLLKEKPEVVITLEHLLFNFVFNIPVILAMKIVGAKLILKSIPFRIPKFDEAKQNASEKSRTVRRLPSALRFFIDRLGLEKFIRMGFLYLRRRAFRAPDAHIDYIEDAFTVFGSYGVSKEKIFITRNSPDTDELKKIEQQVSSEKPVLTSSDHRLIHVGRLVDWKRVDLLLRAFARVRQKFPKADLLIAGFGPLEKELKDLSVQLGVADSVRFLGGVYDQKLLAQYFRASSVYVLAGMGGISINDAMFHRLPVVCSVCDGTEKKLVREGYNGLYFREGDENDLVEKIQTLFSDANLRRKMGERSREIIDKEINIHTVIDGYLKAMQYVTHAPLSVS